MSRTRWLRWGSTVVAACVTFAGINWLMAPSEAELTAEGRELFVHEWLPDDPLSSGGDGLGPVFNAKSCVACHFQGGAGGGGDNQHNVNAFTVLPNRRHDDLRSGVVHAFATSEQNQETEETVRRVNPEIPGSTRVVGGCTIRTEPFDPLMFTSINTPALFGAGIIDDISSGSISSARRGRELDRVMTEFQLDFDRTSAGLLRSHGFGAVGKFGWRGQFDTLEGFVATACAVELGLTNPVRAQDVPHRHSADVQAELDMTSAQLDALVTFCRNLPRPEQVLPTDPDQFAAVQRGEASFVEIGCADCHQPEIGGVAGIYTDFLLYSLEPVTGDGYRRELEVPLPNDMPKLHEWQTPPLWGVADSAPYFHDGQSATLSDAIYRHKGDAKRVLDRFRELQDSRQQDILEFLGSLKAPDISPMTHLPGATASAE